MGAGGQQAQEQRGVGPGALPPAAQVQPGHLQVGERAEPGGASGHVQPHHEDETGDHGANVVIVIVHSSSKATKNESSCPDEISLQMLPKDIWGPENMKIENI